MTWGGGLLFLLVLIIENAAVFGHQEPFGGLLQLPGTDGVVVRHFVVDALGVSQQFEEGQVDRHIQVVQVVEDLFGLETVLDLFQLLGSYGAVLQLVQFRPHGGLAPFGRDTFRQLAADFQQSVVEAARDIGVDRAEQVLFLYERT